MKISTLFAAIVGTIFTTLGIVTILYAVYQAQQPVNVISPAANYQVSEEQYLMNCKEALLTEGLITIEDLQPEVATISAESTPSAEATSSGN